MRGGTLSTNEILFGLGLVLLLAVGSQLVARRLGLPAIVVLLPAGFLAGVSGPTVVLPLLAFIRPTRRVRSLLKWEGVLVDPVGALLGVVVFQTVKSGWEPGDMPFSVLVGVLVGAAGAGVLWLLLRDLHL